MRLILFFIIIPISLFCQVPMHEWVQPFINNSQLIHYPKVLIDQDENIIIGGLYRGVLDFDFLEGEETRDGNIFIMKMTADRSLIWVKTFKTQLIGPVSFDLDLDKEGNVYFTAPFFRKIEETFSDDFPKVLVDKSTLISIDTYFLKLDGNDGKIVYLNTVKQGENDGDARPLSIAVSEEGKVGLLGYFDKEMQFDPAGTIDRSKGYADIYFIQYTDSGDYEWHRTFGNEEYDYGYACDYDQEGNIVIGGVFIYTTDFDTGPDELQLKNYGSYDIFVLKISTKNELLWGQSFGSARTDVLKDISIGRNGEIYAVGDFGGRMDIDPSPDNQELIFTNGENDGLVLRLTKDGELIWHKSFGGPDYDYCESIFVDISGNVYTNCFIKGQAAFTEDEVNVDLNGNFNTVFSKWLNNGQIQWTYGLNSYNGNTNSGFWPLNPGDIVASSNGDLFTTGVFAYGLDFDPSSNKDSITVEPRSKLFIHKLKHCNPLTYKENIKYVDQFTLSNGKVITENGIHLDTLINMYGCDSIIEYSIEIINKNKALNDIKVGPVPTQDFLNILSSIVLEECTFSLINTLGQLVWKSKKIDIIPPRLILNPTIFSVLPHGVYILRIKTGTNYRDFKVLFD